MDTRFREVKYLSEIPKNKYLVYALSIDEKYIVLGRGRYNRAKVIFDNIDRISYNHIKSFKIRLYHLFSFRSNFKREIVVVESQEQAKKIEKEKHRIVGGNSLKIDPQIKSELFKNLKNDRVELLFNIALLSSFSGLNDLRRWAKEKLIGESDWELISTILKLPKKNGKGVRG